MGRIAVVVLGDIGRSPRMQYHSVSLAKAGHDVDLVGYSGSKPHRLVAENAKINLRHLKEPPPAGGVFGLAVKCLRQAATLFWCLMITLAKLDAILLQNPPGLPALLVCWMVARLRGAKFLVDWHNYTWSILALKWGKDHLLVRFVRWYEYKVGSWADDGFCVTDAMRNDLLQSLAPGIQLRVFYDRPLKNVFGPVSIQRRHQVMERMAEMSLEIFGGDTPGTTKFTEQLPLPFGAQLRRDRPALLISSTSWTADEDFGLLFDALTIYDGMVHGRPKTDALPKIVCVITGKGPLKDYYLSRLPQWNNVQLCTPWLTAEDYPLLMACADLGVCLHASSSGLDLPMKAVDMLGCRVPVLALNYNCIQELIKEDRNGRLFDDARSLADALADLLTAFDLDSIPDTKDSKLKMLRRQLNEDRADGPEWDWESNWNEVVGPVIMRG